MDEATLARALAGHQIYSEDWTAPGGVSIVCVCTEVVFVPSPSEKEYEEDLNRAFAGHQASKIAGAAAAPVPDAAPEVLAA